MTKTCRRCGLDKSAVEFYKNYLAADGLHTKCKECSRIIAQKNRDKKKQSKRR